MKQPPSQLGGRAKEARACKNQAIIAPRPKVSFSNTSTEWQTPLQVVVSIEEFRVKDLNTCPDFKGIKTSAISFGSKLQTI